MVNKNQDELGSKREVGLLNKAFGVHHPALSLTVYGYLLGNPPLGALPQISILLKMAILDHVAPVVKLWGAGTFTPSVASLYRKRQIVGEIFTRPPRTRTYVSAD